MKIIIFFFKDCQKSTNPAHSAFAPFPPPVLPRCHKLPNEHLHYFTPLSCFTLLCFVLKCPILPSCSPSLPYSSCSPFPQPARWTHQRRLMMNLLNYLSPAALLQLGSTHARWDLNGWKILRKAFVFLTGGISVCAEQLWKRVPWLAADAFDCQRLPRARLLIASTNCHRRSGEGNKKGKETKYCCVFWFWLLCLLSLLIVVSFESFYFDCCVFLVFWFWLLCLLSLLILIVVSFDCLNGDCHRRRRPFVCFLFIGRPLLSCPSHTPETVNMLTLFQNKGRRLGGI